MEVDPHQVGRRGPSERRGIRVFVDDLMSGNANPAAVGAVLATQQQLGLTSGEVRGAAKAMIGHAIKLDVRGRPLTLSHWR